MEGRPTHRTGPACIDDSMANTAPTEPDTAWTPPDRLVASLVMPLSIRGLSRIGEALAAEYGEDLVMRHSDDGASLLFLQPGAGDQNGPRT